MDPTEITLSKKTPGVAELTGMWEDGGVYPCTIEQVTSDASNVTLRITSEAPEEATEVPMPPVAPKPKMKKVAYPE